MTRPPLDPDVTVATPLFDEVQLARFVTLAVVLSEYVAVAVHWSEVPTVKVVVWQDTETLWTVLLLTVSGEAVEMTLPDVAVILVTPRETAVASPDVSMVAMLVADDVHVTWSVTSPVVLLPKVPVAEYCCVPVGKMSALAGEMVMEVMVDAEGKNWPQLANRTASAKAARISP